MNKIDITVNELFSGIGAQKRGIDLTRLFNCKVISTSDIDKEAMVSYAAIHCGLTKELINTYDKYPSKEEMAKLLSSRNIGYDFKKNEPYNWNKHIKQKNTILEKYYLACILSDNLGDISLINELPYADFWTYSFPCQDISVAGLQEGIKEGTRSGLLKEVERLLDVANGKNIKPKFLLLENVKNLVGKNNKPDFDAWIDKLDKLGYYTPWKVINGKDCGIPQNRERTFAISIRKDIDTGLFEFNKPFDNGLRLRDLLDEAVDDKYYISDDKVEKFFSTYNNTNNNNTETDSLVRLGNVYGEQFGTGYAGNVWDKNCLCPALMTMQGGGRQPHVIDDNEIVKLFDLPKDIVNDNERQRRVYSEDGVSPTVLARTDNAKILQQKLRIRKLIPTECFRLMGFTDRDIKLCMDMGISDSQLYKQAGNSIITYCIMLLMEHLYKAQYDNTYVCTDERILKGEVIDIDFTQPPIN